MPKNDLIRRSSALAAVRIHHMNGLAATLAAINAIPSASLDEAMDRREKDSVYAVSGRGVKQYARGKINADGIAESWVLDERRGPRTHS